MSVKPAIPQARTGTPSTTAMLTKQAQNTAICYNSHDFPECSSHNMVSSNSNNESENHSTDDNSNSHSHLSRSPDPTGRRSFQLSLRSCYRSCGRTQLSLTKPLKRKERIRPLVQYFWAPGKKHSFQVFSPLTQVHGI